MDLNKQIEIKNWKFVSVIIFSIITCFYLFFAREALWWPFSYLGNTNEVNQKYSEEQLILPEQQPEEKPYWEVWKTNPPATKEEIASWQLYQNTKYGYSIRFPKGFFAFVPNNSINDSSIILPSPESNPLYIINNGQLSALLGGEILPLSIVVVEGTIDLNHWQQFLCGYFKEGQCDQSELSQVNVDSIKEIVVAGRKAMELVNFFTAESVIVFPRLILIPGQEYSFVINPGFNGEPWNSIFSSLSFAIDKIVQWKPASFIMVSLKDGVSFKDAEATVQKNGLEVVEEIDLIGLKAIKIAVPIGTERKWLNAFRFGPLFQEYQIFNLIIKTAELIP